MSIEREARDVLECVVNVSEGRDRQAIAAMARAARPSLLDVHSDAHHNRSVLTLGGDGVEEDTRRLARAAVALLDIRAHQGVHPRLGVLDVVPFVPLDPAAGLTAALEARDRFASWAASELGLPCFLYGPGRSLPDVRRRAFADLAPDAGPATPHETAGAVCVGARPPMVAYNLWLAAGATRARAREIAASLRGPHVRALGLDVGGTAQVSCNLIDPVVDGPAQVYDAVSRRAPVDRAELVGLVPAAVLDTVEPGRWAQLDLHPSRTIEARIDRARWSEVVGLGE